MLDFQKETRDSAKNGSGRKSYGRRGLGGNGIFHKGWSGVGKNAHRDGKGRDDAWVMFDSNTTGRQQPHGWSQRGYSEKSAGKNVDCSSSVIAVSEAHSLWTLPIYASLTSVYFFN